MLTATELRQSQRRRRRLPSLMQQYQEYVMQRIEGFKNSIERDELLRLGDEAVSEMQATSEGQFVLTEVLMLDSVDRLITKRLSLRSYRRWRQQFLTLRKAQREPTHWGLEGSCPVALLLPRIEPEDAVLVVGGGAEECAYLLAAHDAAVTFIAGDLGCVERVESRMTSESLASLFTAYVVQLGGWLPPMGRPLDLVVLDAGALADLSSAARAAVVCSLQECTSEAGVHVLVPGAGRLAPAALLSSYDVGWDLEERRGRRRGAARSPGLVLARRPVGE
jgi:hypothetical protein